MLLVTHYQRILDHVKPDKVHVFMNGRIVRSGGPELARELEERGYDWVTPSEDTAASQTPTASTQQTAPSLAAER